MFANYDVLFNFKFLFRKYTIYAPKHIMITDKYKSEQFWKRNTPTDDTYWLTDTYELW